MSATIAQCKSCPWHVGCDPVRDIPGGYSVELHIGLAGTIATPGVVHGGALRVMACHYSDVGKEHVCAGWLHNQIGDGNNIQARLAVMTGRLPSPEVTGEQHATFDDTLPRATAVSRSAQEPTMSAALSAPTIETWCIVTDVEHDVGTVKSVHAGSDGYDDAIHELEHPDELWLRFDAPAVGSHIVRRDRRSA